MNNEKKSRNSFVPGFLLGGIIGALVIFFLGTKEGKKAAHKIMSKAENIEDELDKKLHNVRKQGEAFVKEAQEMKDRITEEVEDKKHEVSDGLKEKLDATLTQIEDLQEKGVKLTKEVQRRVFTKNGKKLNS